MLHCQFHATDQVPEAKKKMLFDYSSISCEMINNEMSFFTADFLCSFHLSGSDENWRIVRRKLISLELKYIQKVVITSSTQNMWFTSNVKHCINKRKSLYSKEKLTVSDRTWKLHHKHAQRCQNEIQTAKFLQS